MASEKDATCENDQNFAIICAFFQKFSTMLNIQHPNIQLLKEWFENTDEVSPGLKDLHIKLLRKLRKTVHETAWETALAKFCYLYSSKDAWELERFGYKKSSLKVKLRILKELLEYQFQRNGRFRNHFSALPADDLRGQPIGRDRLGHSYWFTHDRHSNIRIYQEHLDEEIWQVVATTREELVTLISRLKGNEVVLPSVSIIDEDSSSNSCPVTVAKPPPPEEEDDSQDEKLSFSEERIPNIKIKLDTSKIVANSNELETDSESDYRGEDDTEVDKDIAGEKSSREDSKTGIKVEKNEEIDGNESSDDKKYLSIDDKNLSRVKIEQENGHTDELEKKVKPIIISQSKIAAEKLSKKRILEESEIVSSEDENLSKKCRPTLLGNNRVKKISRYEKFEEDSSDEDDGEEEGTEEEECTPEDDEEEVGQEEDVGEEIEEDLMVIKCEGSGNECESSNLNLMNYEFNNSEEIVGEAIEDDVMLVMGEGSGFECFVGNSKDISSKEELCVEKSGCENVGDNNKDCSLTIEKEGTSNKEFRNSPDVETNDNDAKENKLDELTNGESGLETEVNLKTNEKNELPTDEITVQKSDIANDSDKETCSPNTESSDLIKMIDTKPEASSLNQPEMPEVPIVKITESNKKDKENISTEVKSHENEETVSEMQDDCSAKANITTELSPEARAISPQKCIPKNRKRRLSEEKPQQNSESETDLNSEDNEEQSMEEEQNVGGKRPKMRCKLINSSIRRKFETDRNSAEKGSSSSEEEVPSKDDATKDFLGSSETKTDSLFIIPVIPEEKEICEQNENILKIETPAVENCQKSSELHTKSCEKQTLESVDEKLPSPKSNSSEKIPSPTDTAPEKLSPPQESLSEKAFPLEGLISPEITSPSVKASSPKPECPQHEGEIAQVQTRSGRKKPTPMSAPGKRRGRGGGGPRNFCRGRKSKKVESNDQATAASNESPGKIELPQSTEDDNIKNDTEKTTEQETENVSAMDNSQDDVAPSEKIVKTENSLTAKDEVASNADDKSNLINDDNKDGIKRKKQRKKREIDVSNIIDADSDIAPVRQSRRIAQLKIREEAERRKMEEVALKKMKEQLKKKKKEEKQYAKDITYKSESSDKNESVDSEMEMKKRVEKKKRGLKKGGWSSGTEDEPEEEIEDEFQYYETDPGSPLFKSDHEFSPESEIEDESQIVPTKRARTARREGEEGPEVAVGSDESCQKCGKSDHPEWILLCDKCDKGYHCSCLSPVLFIIPEGDWFCPPCQQEQLIEALEVQLKEFDELVIKRKEEEDLRIRNLEILKAQEHQMRIVSAGKQPRKRPERRSQKSSDDDSYSMEAVNSRSGRSSSRSSGSGSATTTSSSSSSSSATDSDDEPIYKLRKRRQMNMSYRFNEFDDLINSAIKHEMDEVAGAGNLGRGKDISTIIEADKEEKLRLKQLEAQKDLQVSHSESVPLAVENAAEILKNETIQENDSKIKEDSGSDFEPFKAKPKLSSRKSLKKKNRKLNCLDVSSDDDGSDEDFKTSSYDTDEDEESLSGGGTGESESSLEVYKRKSKKNKKNSRRSTRRAARQIRKRYDDFIVDDSEGSAEIPKIKKKKKEDSDYSESETEEELTEDVDSEDLCDDSTETDSDRAWKPGKRKKQRIISKRKEPKKKSSKSSKKHKRADNERPFKSSKSKNRIIDYDDDSLDGSRKTRGKRFTYLEDYEDESSDDGIKPGVKRPDTPPEEREQFIKRQEEIKRMLAEKNTEAAKVAATPTMTPLQQKDGKSQGPADATASLSTVPLSVIKGAKVLDMDYLQRRGELESDDAESEEFDDNLPEDFNPDDMDEEEIAKMMEEEDFAQQQQKLAGEAIRQKRLKEPESNKPEAETPRIYRAAPAPIYDTTRKRLPIPTPHPPLRNPPLGQMFNNPQFSRSNFMLGRSLPQHSDRNILQRSLSGVQGNANPLVRSNPPLSVNPGVQPISSVPNSQIPTVLSQASLNEPQKPRGRRKKITPLRDTLQKQQAAAAAAAATGPVPPSPLPVQAGPSRQPAQSVPLGENNKDSIPGGEKLSGPDLSVAQPPQLYKPSNTQPSVITRMAQPPRSRFPDPGVRFFGPPNQIGPRHPAARLPPMTVPPHHGMRPSFASGPPPLRPANTGPPPPVSLGNGIGRHPLSTRPPPPFSTSDQFSLRPRPTPPLNPYRPPLYGSPGYPPAPPGHSTPQGPPVPQPAGSLHTGDNVYSAPSFAAATFGNYYPPPIGSTHSTPPPPTATAVPSSVIVSANANTSSPPVSVVAEPLQPSPPSRPKATPLETFNSKSTPPPESESTRSPYSAAPIPDENDEEIIRSNSSSEFSGLVSYFSSQQDDLNT